MKQQDWSEKGKLKKYKRYAKIDGYMFVIDGIEKHKSDQFK